SVYTIKTRPSFLVAWNYLPRAGPMRPVRCARRRGWIWPLSILSWSIWWGIASKIPCNVPPAYVPLSLFSMNWMVAALIRHARPVQQRLPDLDQLPHQSHLVRRALRLILHPPARRPCHHCRRTNQHLRVQRRFGPAALLLQRTLLRNRPQRDRNRIP